MTRGAPVIGSARAQATGQRTPLGREAPPMVYRPDHDTTIAWHPDAFRHGW